MARFEKDFRQLSRQIDSISGGQARTHYENIFHNSTSKSRASTSSSSSSDSDEYPSQEFYIEITPCDGPYAHGSFIFRIEASTDSDYPDCQPIVSCITRIYHPNIDTTYENRHNNVCVSTLNDWDGGNSTFEDLLQGLMFLFHSPNVDDPLTSNITTDEKEFLINVRIAIEGGLIEDYDNEPFEMNYGYKRYLSEQEKQYIEEGEKLDDNLINILTREPNFKQIFNSDTLDFLINNTSASSIAHSTRHNKETSINS